MDRGLGYVDVHLLAAAALQGSASLWTRDKRLRAAADSLSLGHVTGQGPSRPLNRQRCEVERTAVRGQSLRPFSRPVLWCGCRQISIC